MITFFTLAVGSLFGASVSSGVYYVWLIVTHRTEEKKQQLLLEFNEDYVTILKNSAREIHIDANNAISYK